MKNNFVLGLLLYCICTNVVLGLSKFPSKTGPDHLFQSELVFDHLFLNGKNQILGTNKGKLSSSLKKNGLHISNTTEEPFFVLVPLKNAYEWRKFANIGLMPKLKISKEGYYKFEPFLSYGWELVSRAGVYNVVSKGKVRRVTLSSILNFYINERQTVKGSHTTLNYNYIIPIYHKGKVKDIVISEEQYGVTSKFTLVDSPFDGIEIVLSPYNAHKKNPFQLEIPVKEDILFLKKHENIKENYKEIPKQYFPFLSISKGKTINYRCDFSSTCERLGKSTEIIIENNLRYNDKQSFLGRDSMRIFGIKTHFEVGEDMPYNITRPSSQTLVLPSLYKNNLYKIKLDINWRINTNFVPIKNKDDLEGYCSSLGSWDSKFCKEFKKKEQKDNSLKIITYLVLIPFVFTCLLLYENLTFKKFLSFKHIIKILTVTFLFDTLVMLISITWFDSFYEGYSLVGTWSIFIPLYLFKLFIYIRYFGDYIIRIFTNPLSLFFIQILFYNNLSEVIKVCMSL